MNNAFNKVKEFHEKFNHPVSNKPVMLNFDRMATRVSWMLSEIQELKKAETIHDQADALIDLMYFAVGTFVEMGVYPEKLFNIVHDANMKKLWPDGKPHYRPEDGKVIKPEGWQAPDEAMKKEIKMQAAIKEIIHGSKILPELNQ